MYNLYDMVPKTFYICKLNDFSDDNMKKGDAEKNYDKEKPNYTTKTKGELSVEARIDMFFTVIWCIHRVYFY